MKATRGIDMPRMHALVLMKSTKTAETHTISTSNYIEAGGMEYVQCFPHVESYLMLLTQWTQPTINRACFFEKTFSLKLDALNTDIRSYFFSVMLNVLNTGTNPDWTRLARPTFTTHTLVPLSPPLYSKKLKMWAQPSMSFSILAFIFCRVCARCL